MRQNNIGSIWAVSFQMHPRHILHPKKVVDTNIDFAVIQFLKYGHIGLTDICITFILDLTIKCDTHNA